MCLSWNFYTFDPSPNFMYKFISLFVEKVYNGFRSGKWIHFLLKVFDVFVNRSNASEKTAIFRSTDPVRAGYGSEWQAHPAAER